MTDMLAQGAAWLADQQKTFASCPVVYRRGGASEIVQATLGRSEAEYDDGYGGIVKVQCRDFLIHTADLILGDEPTLPVAGDTIEETTDGQTVIYEVMAFGDEPCFRYTDPYHTRLRIHTKHVTTL